LRFQTKAIHSGISPDSAYGAIVPPIYQNTAFAFEDVNKHKGFDYSRTGNPTRKVLEDNLAALEGGKHCVALTTGMAAETTILSLFKNGDHIICGNDVYGGTFRLFEFQKEQSDLEVTYISMIEQENIETAIRENTKAIWVETPSNPLLNIVDLEKTAAFAHSNNLIMIVDNTFLSPAFQRPFEFGADIVIHSTTKYLGGHNDGLGGAVICIDDELGEKIAYAANALGTTASAFESWLIIRGIKTLPLRMREHEKNALAIASFLQKQDFIKKVNYPGLEDHPQYELIQKQMLGNGGMVSFEVNGDINKVNKILKNTKLFYLAESFGSVESLIEHPKTMSHAAMTPEAQKAGGITDRLIRLSVGIEDKEDLITDLEQALYS
jgi:cystathionine gamma-synthase